MTGELHAWNFETVVQVIQETQTIFGHISKEEFETTIKKIGQKNESMFSHKGIFRRIPTQFKTIIKKLVERMEACLALDGWYFEKGNMASKGEEDVSE